MNRIAQFEKVSFDQFKKDWLMSSNSVTNGHIHPQFAEHLTQQIYDEIKLPKRATSGSAGYDFFSPDVFELKPGETVKIPSGIRVKIDEGWVLQNYPRSSLGFKYRLQLNNTVGIIDSDYYYSDNEGHIFIKITNDTNEDKTITINKADAFVQGIFVPFGITYDDNVTEIRNGGMGSTNK